jgi:radical SAM-linked protein
MRLRTQYSVGPDLKFLANLDMMHLMERALRRAEIPYLLSEGFNPHIRMSMGTILPVGLWGEKEYFDLELSSMSTVDFTIKMNNVLPPGMRIQFCQEISLAAPSLMKVINAADYAFKIKYSVPELEIIAARILEQPELSVQSRSKNKSVFKNLRPGIYRISIEPDNEAAIVNVMVSVNEPLNVRFDELLDMFSLNGIDRELMLDFWRQGNYIRQEVNFSSPLEIGRLNSFHR